MRDLKIISCGIVIVLMLCCGSFGQTPAQPPEPILSSIVFFGMPGLKEIGGSSMVNRNECFQKYLKAIPPKSFLLTAKAPSGPENALDYRRRNLREQIVVMMGEKTRAEAEAFARDLPLYVEWEGMSESPLNEANFADNWLRKRSGTTIAAFLYLFKAHRFRAGYEAAKAGQEKCLWPVLAVKYREALEKALSFNNPLISCIAKDMEEQPYVYLEGYGKP